MTDPQGDPPPVTQAYTPPPNPYGYGGYGYGYGYGYPVPQPPTNGLATASMIVSIVGAAAICAWGPLSLLISPVGAILGHVARSKVKKSGERGEGMALTAIIVGWIGVVLELLYLAFFVAMIVWGEDWVISNQLDE
jgi:Domain of unknown function (DUF4190)